MISDDDHKLSQEIERDAEAARVTPEQFDRLLDYSCSMPSGVFLGKVWKRRVDYHDESKGWLLGEYLSSRGQIIAHWRDLELIGIENPKRDIEVHLL